MVKPGHVLGWLAAGSVATVLWLAADGLDEDHTDPVYSTARYATLYLHLLLSGLRTFCVGDVGLVSIGSSFVALAAPYGFAQRWFFYNGARNESLVLDNREMPKIPVALQPSGGCFRMRPSALCPGRDYFGYVNEAAWPDAVAANLTLAELDLSFETAVAIALGGTDMSTENFAYYKPNSRAEKQACFDTTGGAHVRRRVPAVHRGLRGPPALHGRVRGALPRHGAAGGAARARAHLARGAVP